MVASATRTRPSQLTIGLTTSFRNDRHDGIACLHRGRQGQGPLALREMLDTLSRSVLGDAQPNRVGTQRTIRKPEDHDLTSAPSDFGHGSHTEIPLLMDNAEQLGGKLRQLVWTT